MTEFEEARKGIISEGERERGRERESRDWESQSLKTCCIKAYLLYVARVVLYVVNRTGETRGTQKGKR